MRVRPSALCVCHTLVPQSFHGSRELPRDPPSQSHPVDRVSLGDTRAIVLDGRALRVRSQPRAQGGCALWCECVSVWVRGGDRSGACILYSLSLYIIIHPNTRIRRYHTEPEPPGTPSSTTLIHTRPGRACFCGADRQMYWHWPLTLEDHRLCPLVLPSHSRDTGAPQRAAPWPGTSSAAQRS